LKEELQKTKISSQSSAEHDAKTIRHLQEDVESWKKRYEELHTKLASIGSNSGNSQLEAQVTLLQAEVQKWQNSAAQLEQLGTEAVQEVYTELEKEKIEKAEIQTRYDEEKQKREKLEEELAISDQKLKQLDSAFQRLLQIKK